MRPEPMTLCSQYKQRGLLNGAPLVSKFGNLLIRENLVLTSACVRPPAQTLGEGKGRPKATRPEGGECQLFLAGNRTVPFGQPGFEVLNLRKNI